MIRFDQETKIPLILVSAIGIEPTTFRLGGRRSIQLSYTDKQQNWWTVRDSNPALLRARQVFSQLN